MMKHRQWGLYAVALAILVVGLVWAGVPASTLLFTAVLLACPLMMMAMMGGMRGGTTTDGARDRQHHDRSEYSDDRRARTGRPCNPGPSRVAA